jgi:hypothetical protein
MDQGAVAFLSLFVICILFLEQNRCKCAEDEVEGHTSIPWWVFLIAGIWVVFMVGNYFYIKQPSAWWVNKGLNVSLGPIPWIVVIVAGLMAGVKFLIRGEEVVLYGTLPLSGKEGGGTFMRGGGAGPN